MYGTTNYVNLVAYELTNCMVYDAGFKHSWCQIYIYYKYAPYGSRLVVLSYFDDYLYWYTYKEPGMVFLDTS